jgi:hypothetical protein
MYIQQTKEEQLDILQKELQNALELHQLPTFVLCCYLKVMIEIGLCKSDINEYFTTFPVTNALNECKTIIDQLVDDDPSMRDKDVLGTTLGKIMTLHKDAVEIDTFMETHLDLPIQEPISYLNSIEDRMNCARQGFDIVDSTTDPKKFNFYTSTCFEGQDIYDENGRTFIVSEPHKQHTMMDISTSFIQICGRIRNSKYNGEIIHIYATSYYKDYPTLKEFIKYTKTLDTKSCKTIVASDGVSVPGVVGFTLSMTLEKGTDVKKIETSIKEFDGIYLVEDI